MDWLNELQLSLGGSHCHVRVCQSKAFNAPTYKWCDLRSSSAITTVNSQDCFPAHYTSKSINVRNFTNFICAYHITWTNLPFQGHPWNMQRILNFHDVKFYCTVLFSIRTIWIDWRITNRVRRGRRRRGRKGKKAAREAREFEGSQYSRGRFDPFPPFLQPATQAKTAQAFLSASFKCHVHL